MFLWFYRPCLCRHDIQFQFIQHATVGRTAETWSQRGKNQGKKIVLIFNLTFFNKCSFFCCFHNVQQINHFCTTVKSSAILYSKLQFLVFFPASLFWIYLTFLIELFESVNINKPFLIIDFFLMSMTKMLKFMRLICVYLLRQCIFLRAYKWLFLLYLWCHALRDKKLKVWTF